MTMECEHERGMARVVRVDGGNQSVFVKYVESTDLIAVATARWHPAEPVLSLESGDLFEVQKAGPGRPGNVTWSTRTEYSEEGGR